VATPSAPAALGSRTRLRPPASADQILKLTRYQFREYLSSRRYVALVGIVAAIGVIITAIVAHFRGGLVSDPLAFYGTFWGGAAFVVIILAAVFFGGDAIAGEFQNKTGYFLMGLPIRRATVYVGKFIAALAASVSILLLYLIILLLNGAYYFGGSALPWQLGPSVILAVVYLTAVLGTTFMFSSLFKTSAYGFVLTAILFLFGFAILEALVQGLVKTEPWMVISYASSAIGEVFAPSINWGLAGTVTTIVTPTGPGQSVTTVVYTAGVAEGVVIMLAYFVITAVAGLALFEREEFS
jgi:ABC-2 type transport system permease protein